jgi:multidrug efflux pump subunit AcrA (membrane-fusion protein)
MTMKYSRFILASLLGVIGSTLCACDRRAPQAGSRDSSPVAVTVAPVTLAPAERYIDVVGSLYGDEDAIISNKVNGRVIAILKDVGDVAEPGEALAQLLQNDYELDRAQKESALGEVLAKLGLEEPPTVGFDTETLPAVRRARLQAGAAQERFNRGKILHDQDPPLMSDQDFDDLRTAWDVAKTTLDVERLTARELLTQVRTRQVELAIAEQALRDTTVRAPRLDYPPASIGSATQPVTRPSTQPANQGTRRYLVASRMASEGELVRAITPMFRLIDADPVKLRAAVPERYVALLHVGQGVDVSVDAYREPFVGKISRISPQIDPASRTVQIEVVVPNADLRLAPGSFARGRVHTHADSKAIFVPEGAVSSFAGVDKVFLVKDGKATERPIELGQRKGDLIEVTKGLGPNDRIVVIGAQRLAGGTPVVVGP